MAKNPAVTHLLNTETDEAKVRNLSLFKIYKRKGGDGW